MRYIVISMDNAVKYGVCTYRHQRKGGKVIVNEKELLMNPVLTGSVEERVEQTGGTLMSDAEAIQLANKGGWSYE